MEISNTYKVEIYTSDGTFVADVSSRVDVPSISKHINNGDGMLTLTVNVAFTETYTEFRNGYEVRIYAVFGGTQKKIYSGWIYNITRSISDGNQYLKVGVVSYIGRLEKMPFYTSGNRLSTTRDGTNSADTGSLDSKLSSDQMKLAVNLYRFNDGIDDQSNYTGDTNQGFGSTTRVTQAFTTTSTTEKLKLAGVKLYLKYNTGTAGEIGLTIRADDGTGKPTGAGLATCHIPVISGTDYNWINCIFDTPLTLTAATKYHIYFHSSTSSSTSTYHWWTASSGNVYSGGDYTISTDGGSTYTVQTNKDGVFRTIYVDESVTRINYTSSSINSTGDSKVHKYTGLTVLGAMEYVNKYAPADYYYYLDENNTLQYHASGYSYSGILDNCNATTGWTNGQGTGSITTDTSIKVEGSASLKFTLLGTHSTCLIYKAISAVDISAYNNAGCWVYVPATTSATTLYIRLWSTSTTEYRQWTINVNALTKGAWNWLTPFVKIKGAYQYDTTTWDATTTNRIEFGIDVSNSAETSSWYIDDWKYGNVEITDVNYQDLISIEYGRDISKLTNMYAVSNSATSSALLRVYRNYTSITNYGVFFDSRIDGRLTDSTTINEIGNDVIAKNSFEKETLSIKVPKTDIMTSVRPGYLIKIFGLPKEVGINSYYIVTDMQINNADVDFTLINYGAETRDTISDVEERLDMIESYASTTGDIPTAQMNDQN